VNEFSERLNAFDRESDISNDEAALTVAKVYHIIGTCINKDVSGEIQEIWEARMKRKFDSTLLITKRELSVLADEPVRPFERKVIGFNGKYKD
jgi:hypothetical protein